MKVFARTDSLDRPAVPDRVEIGEGALLGFVGHAVAANELPALAADDAEQRLPNIQATHHAFEREVGDISSVSSGFSGSGRAASIPFDAPPNRLRQVYRNCLAIAFDLRLPQRMPHAVVFPVPLPDLVRSFVRAAAVPQSLAVDGSLAFAAFGDGAEKQARRAWSLPSVA